MITKRVRFLAFVFVHSLNKSLSKLIDLRLAAEFGRYLLEQNQELQNYVSNLQKQLDDTKTDMTVGCLKISIQIERRKNILVTSS